MTETKSNAQVVVGNIPVFSDTFGNIWDSGFNPAQLQGSGGSGAQGPAGPQGATGATGPQGPSGSGGSGFTCTTTNDNAAAGQLGECIFAFVSYNNIISFPASNIATDVCSIQLTPGDWDLSASFGAEAAGNTGYNGVECWTNTTSATMPVPLSLGTLFAKVVLDAGADVGQSAILPLGTTRVTVAAGTTQTHYLTGQVVFGTSSLGGFGYISARRAR